MRFVFVDYIPGSTTPARVYRSTGVVLINKSRFDHLPEFTKKFILKHEEGHYKLNTTNEFLADEYASNSLLLTEPGSLKNSIAALDKVLPKNTPEQRLRIREQVKRALRTDAALGNKEALEALTNLIEMENNYEGTYMNQTESFGLNQFIPKVGSTFIDTTKSIELNSFLSKTQKEALGFSKIVPETFVQSIGSAPNTGRIYEAGKEILIDKLQKPLSQTQPREVIATEDLKSETLTDKNIQVKVSNPLFYFLLGVITVLLIALVINLFKE